MDSTSEPGGPACPTTEKVGPDAAGDADGGGGRWAVRARTVLRDLLLVVAWVAVVSIAWGTFSWPAWAYYVVVFGGIAGYSQSGDPWVTDGG